MNGGKYHAVHSKFASMRKAVAEDCYLLALWKLDVDSAFRRIPLHPDHRWAAAVTFMHDDKVC